VGGAPADLLISTVDSLTSGSYVLSVMGAGGGVTRILSVIWRFSASPLP
jgi:hypothetical protein